MRNVARLESTSTGLAESDKATRACLAACPGVTGSDRERLAQMALDMPFVADISRSDLLLYVRCDEREALVVAHAQPHSIVPVHTINLVGQRVDLESEAAVGRVLRVQFALASRRTRGIRRMIAGGAPVTQQILPVNGESGRVIAALGVEANYIAAVRQRSRSKVFQRAVRALQQMLLSGELDGAEDLSPFSSDDGILVVDRQRMIRYASGIATELFRRLGYQDSLVGRHLSSLDTADYAFSGQVLQSLVCLEEETEEAPYLRGGRPRVWTRKAAPLITLAWNRSEWKPWRWFRRLPTGVLLTIHDATEERLEEQERKVQAALVKEIHHRVKNNLQTVASLMRMKRRRAKNEETRRVLQDSENRILSMAVVHEYLSRADHQAINIREVAQRIIQEVKRGVLSDEKQIEVSLEAANNLYLPARQATACALVINELLQNAIEHGYEGRDSGQINIRLEDRGDEVCIVVADDGEGLPPGFELGQTNSLGLQIVQTLAEGDLQGSFELQSSQGTTATVRFSKMVWEDA
jgi:two-component sensor histidine kinase/PAS domain-containing protein